MPASTLSPHPCVPAQVLAREREADGKLRLGGRGDGKEWGRKQVWEGSLSRVKGPLCTYYPEHPGHGQSPRSSPPSPPWWLQKGIPAPGGDHLGPLKLNLYSNLRRGARLPPGPQRPGSSSRRPSSKGTGPLLPDIMQGAAVGVPGGWWLGGRGGAPGAGPGREELEPELGTGQGLGSGPHLPPPLLCTHPVPLWPLTSFRSLIPP